MAAKKSSKKAAKKKGEPLKKGPNTKSTRGSPEGGATGRGKSHETPTGRPRTSQKLEEKGEGSFLENYLEYLGLGMKKDAAAELAGTDPSTVRDWEVFANEDFEAERESIFTRFVVSCREVRAERQRANLMTVRNARRGDWRAAQWLLQLDGYNPEKTMEGDIGGQQVKLVFDAQDKNA